MKRLPIILLLALLASCSTTRYVEVPRVHEVHDTLRLVNRERETFLVHDSIHVMGDTIYRERTIYRDRVAADTIVRIKERTDTITVVREVVKTERRISGKQALFAALVGALLALAAKKKLS